MSIYDFLSVNQVNAFIDLIRNECNRVAWNAAERARPLPQDLYEKLVKGRKEHDIDIPIKPCQNEINMI